VTRTRDNQCDCQRAGSGVSKITFQPRLCSCLWCSPPAAAGAVFGGHEPLIPKTLGLLERRRRSCLVFIQVTSLQFHSSFPAELRKPGARS
jgi:hypothetical protein